MGLGPKAPHPSHQVQSRLRLRLLVLLHGRRHIQQRELVHDARGGRLRLLRGRGCADAHVEQEVGLLLLVLLLRGRRRRRGRLLPSPPPPTLAPRRSPPAPEKGRGEPLLLRHLRGVGELLRCHWLLRVWLWVRLNQNRLLSITNRLWSCRRCLRLRRGPPPLPWPTDVELWFGGVLHGRRLVVSALPCPGPEISDSSGWMPPMLEVNISPPICPCLSSRGRLAARSCRTSGRRPGAATSSRRAPSRP